MNYKKSILPLLLVGMLAACNSDEELIQTNPNYVEAGYGALTVTLTNPGGASTKAGETLEGVATTEEKEIKSVAFFVQTQTEEVNGETMYGKFGTYFSTDEPLSSSGLLEELKEVAEGEYTAKILHKSDGWKDPEVIVIANYAENGLTEKLKGVQTLSALKEVVATTLTDNPQLPLLMYDAQTVDSWVRGGNNTNGGGSASVTFEMERLVSRIDIHNNAYNADKEEEGFVLLSAQLIRPKTSSILVPNPTVSATIPVSDQPFPLRDEVVAEDGIQRIDTLYAYENANVDADGASATATAVQVNGVFRGGNISKIIDFKQTVNGTEKVIPLARNTRYVININPAPDSTDVVWDIQIKEWNEADTIKVKPKFPAPVMENIVTEGFEEGLSWDAATKTITTDGTKTGTMTFETNGTTASIFALGYKYAKDGSSLDTDELPIIKADDPIITYAAGVKTLFTINVPKPKKDSGVPIDVYVIIQNGGNIQACDTITIKCRPNYYNTSEKPLLMKDGKYWAPVNVGATAIPTSVTTTPDSTTWGDYFQWGRKCSFSVTDTVSTTATQVKVSDLTGFEEQDTWKDKFITSENWLADNSVKNLWNSGTENAPVKTSSDPCPAGWRVPTLAEWKAIGSGRDYASGLLKIDGIEGATLVLPAAGSRWYNSGNVTGQGSSGYYWTSSAVAMATSTNACNILFRTSAALSDITNLRGNGFPVRCIQE